MFYVECNTETTLLKTLGIPRRKIRHVHGKGNVCNLLKKQKNSIGIIDEDPGSAQPTYLKELKLIEEKDDLKCLTDKNNNQIIVICPEIEDWIFKTSKEDRVDLKKYNLPDNLHNFRKEVELKLDRFELLLRELINKSQRMKTLLRLIEQSQSF